jgi:respiratory burst oxidase
MSLSTNPSEREEERSVRAVNVLRSSRQVLTLQGKDAAVNRAFDELDLKGDGHLDRSEIAIFMEAAAKQIRLEIEREVIECAVDALLQDVDSTGQEPAQSFITRMQFLKIFERHPDMLCVFEDETTLSSRRGSVITRPLSQDELLEEEQERNQIWMHAHTRWKNGRVAWMWLAIYVAINVTFFTYKAVLYANDDAAQAVFGQCITVARGCANCLNLNAFLILLPMCRHLVTRTRALGKLRFWFPFDAVLEFHMLVGIAIAMFATAHVAAHICDFHRFARADEEDIFNLFGTKLGDTIPVSKLDRWLLLLKQPAGVTGIIMVVCMLIGYCTILGRRKKFNTFWATHHLLLVMLVALCFHGIGSLLEPFRSVYWVAGPLLLYLFSRVYRETNLAKCQVLDIAIKGGNVVGLKLAKPASWEKQVRAGMYAFINIPKVSPVEWHPFTLTSAPHEDFIEFHFAQVGDWTKSVHGLLAAMVDTTAESKDATRMQDLVVKIEGPIGASSQGFADYPILVLVGAGIGVTPMISVLKQLVKEPGKMKRTFLYWTVRDRASFEWFAALMDDIYASDQKNVLQIRHFLTSVKDDDRDLGAVLLHHATRATHKRTDFDLMLGRRGHHQVEVGRPDWDEELASVRAEAKELGMQKCGIFLCGPERMAEDIAEVSFKLSVEDPDFHFYFTKETF